MIHRWVTGHGVLFLTGNSAFVLSTGACERKTLSMVATGPFQRNKREVDPQRVESPFKIAIHELSLIMIPVFAVIQLHKNAASRKVIGKVLQPIHYASHMYILKFAQYTILHSIFTAYAEPTSIHSRSVRHASLNFSFTASASPLLQKPTPPHDRESYTQHPNHTT